MKKLEDKQNYRISLEDIMNELNKKECDIKYKIYNTYFIQGDKRWRRGYKRKFQESLVNDKLLYFAYIKFYLDEGKKYALVAGKSGSKIVNTSSGCDLAFDKCQNNGLARKWLCENRKEWCETEILIISTGIKEIKDSCKDSLSIERCLVSKFGLFES
jgi:hypothetical protein